MTYRQLMRQYQTNIELVDPQLKNNEPLVKVITDFENSWSLAQGQIGQPDRLEQLDQFSKLIIQTQKDLPQFKEQVECRDASIFMSIPALLIMQALLNVKDSVWRSLCKRFKEDITNQDDWQQTESQFKSLIGAKTLLRTLKLQVLDLDPHQGREMQCETNSVKHLGMELQRSQPMEWNEFMTACLVE